MANTGLTKLYLYRRICSPICARTKTVFKAEKMLGLVILNGVVMWFVQQMAVHYLSEVFVVLPLMFETKFVMM